MGIRESLFGEVKAPLESVMLSMIGVMSLTASALLLPISRGELSYYENGFLGLLLFVMAIQIVTLGKGPFGDVKRDLKWTVTGSVIGCVGIFTCFIPGFWDYLPRIAVFVCLGLGGAVMLLRLCLDRKRLRCWLRLGGIFYHLILACGSVYLISASIGLSLWFEGAISATVYSALLAGHGLFLIYLSLVLVGVYREYPPYPEEGDRSVALDPGEAMMLLVGIFMVLLGLTLIPVSLGYLPFSGGAQLGLLMVIFAVQTLAFGNTPIGSFPRSPVVMSIGLVCAVLGTASCMVPDLLVAFLTLAVGVLNVLGGSIGLVKLWSGRGKGPDFPILKKLSAVQVAVYLFSILFGSSMLMSGLLPGTVIGVILALNGATLLYMLRLLTVIDVMRKAFKG